MKHTCKCRPEDRRLTFINLNGQNTYVCKVCGRWHANREPVSPIFLTAKRLPVLDKVLIGTAALAWLLLIIVGKVCGR